MVLAGLGQRVGRGAGVAGPPPGRLEEVGDGVEVLATTRAGGAGGGRAVAVRSGRLLATSFHPEITGDHRVQALFVSMITG